MKSILAVVVAVSMVSAAWADEKEDLANAAKKSSEAKNYSFKGESKTELPAFGGGQGGPQESKFEGKFESGVGTIILTDQQEIVKVGGKTASRPRAEWRVTNDNAEGGGGGGGRGGRGGMMGGMLGRGTTKAPHEDLKDFGAKIEKATKADRKETIGETECEIISFTLTEDAAKAMMPGGGMMGRMAQDATITGEGKAFIADGAIVKIEVTVKITASFQGNDFEVTTTRSTLIYDVDKTKVEIPADAKKAIDKAAD